MKMRRTQVSDPAELSKTLKRIEKKIDLLVGKIERERPAKKREEVAEAGGLDVMTLLSFPDHLRKSAMTLMKLGKAMAEDVARETGRARAIESAYLNQLARMGYVKKLREGRRVYFSLEGNQANMGSLINPKVAEEGG
jgi:DNA-binding transcriptional ArsR family regulator